VHGLGPTDNILKGVPLGDLPVQLLDQGEVAKGLHRTHYLAFIIGDDRGGDADRNFLIVAVENIDLDVDDVFSCLGGVLQRARLEADVGTEYLVAVLANGLISKKTGDSLGSPVERGDSSLVIHGEDPVRNAVEDEPSPAGIVMNR